MSPSLPEEELGGDPPCWASQFEEPGDLRDDSTPVAGEDDDETDAAR